MLVKEERCLPFTKEQLFALVRDVEQYPEFLPWCLGARILEKNANVFTAELVISFKNFTENYISEVTLNEFDNIDVKLIRGPFKYLKSSWTFKDSGAGGTIIDFNVEFEFKSKILQKLIGMVFEIAQKKMINAFEKRANEIYNK